MNSSAKVIFELLLQPNVWTLNGSTVFLYSEKTCTLWVYNVNGRANLNMPQWSSIVSAQFLFRSPSLRFAVRKRLLFYMSQMNKQREKKRIDIGEEEERSSKAETNVLLKQIEIQNCHREELPQYMRPQWKRWGVGAGKKQRIKEFESIFNPDIQHMAPKSFHNARFYPTRAHSSFLLLSEKKIMWISGRNRAPS